MSPATLVRRIPLSPHQLTAAITPVSDVFVLAHLGIPEVDAKTWTLEIGGLVDVPRRMTLEEIHRRPKRTVQSFHQCAGYPRRPDLPTRRIANVVWGGADLADLLSAAKVRPEARFLWSFGLDHGTYDGERADFYLKDLPLDRLAQGDVLLAYEINGEPLPLEHGFPLRLVVPGYYGTNHVKWLHRLELADRRADGPFTTTFYNDPISPQASGSPAATRPVWGVAPESVIVAPEPGAAIAPAPIEVRGWAWAAAGVTRVEVSTDNGASWHLAELGSRSQWSWQQFRYLWMPPVSGAATLLARATDGAGRTQPAAGARNAVHRVDVMVGPAAGTNPRN